jgi:hypothetical protein
MTINKTNFTLVALLLATLCLSAVAAAPTLKFTFKDVAIKGALEVDSYAINDAGTITGDYTDSAGTQHGMILTNKGVLTSFDNKNCQSSGETTGSIAAFGINKKNEVAGWCYSTKTGEPISWVYNNGKFANIAYPKAAGTIATGINNVGEVVGLYVDSAGNAFGFLYDHKKYTQIAIKGATATAAWAIDDAGDITVETGAGYSSGSLTPPIASYLLSGGNQTSLSDPNAGSDGTVVHAVNNHGDIDGTYYDSAGNTHGWLLYQGSYYDVEDPNGPNLSRADGLNDTLSIVGRYSPSAGGNVGFKATTKK